MKTIITTENEREALRLLKSADMVSFIWELKHNGWRHLEHSGYDWQPAWEKINELLDYYEIDIDQLHEG